MLALLLLQDWQIFEWLFINTTARLWQSFEQPFSSTTSTRLTDFKTALHLQYYSQTMTDFWNNFLPEPLLQDFDRFFNDLLLVLLLKDFWIFLYSHICCYTLTDFKIIHSWATKLIFERLLIRTFTCILRQIQQNVFTYTPSRLTGLWTNFYSFYYC